VTREALPTVTGFSVKCAVAALRKRNVAAGPLLHRAGLSERDLDNPKRRVSAAAQGEFLEYAAEALNDTAFGLHLAEAANPREAGLLYYVASAAGNLGEAVVLLARYFRIINESVRLKMRRQPDGLIVEANFFGVGRHRVRQNTEFQFAVLVKASREITGREVCPTRVACVHERTADLREFERFYGCPVEFGKPADQLVFSYETLTLPLITQDPHLLETLRPFCEEAARARETAPGSIRALVENEAQRLLPDGRARTEVVARALAVSPRTLSRRLSEEGTTFAEVIDQLRRSLAAQYLNESSFTLSQIGWLLGYEDPTSFNHAFKRWTGRSPSAARNQARLPGSASARVRQDV
jgi:AraC-like DNA-binding protein